MFDLYERAVGQSIAVVRLVALPAQIQERLRRRHRDDDAGLRWHLERARALDGILDVSTVKMAVVSASATPPTVAAAVVTAAGWAPTPST